MLVAQNITVKHGKKSILANLTFKADIGDFVCITGESGKGKTSLLNVLGFLDKPVSGIMRVDTISSPTKKQTMFLQREKFGYIFQNYALIENETVEKNIKLALYHKKDINKKNVIKEALFSVGLENYENKRIYELSGGEQQRVAFARVIAKDCSYIFADEPTGNLDKKNRDIVFGLLKDMNHMGKTVIYVTHDEELASQAYKRLDL